MRNNVIILASLAILVFVYSFPSEAGYVRQGAKDTSAEIKKGWHATKSDAKEGASATSGEVKKGWHATGKFFKKVF